MQTTLPQPESGEAQSLGYRLTLPMPVVLQSGVTLKDVTVAYQTYGALNANRSNCVLVCHALTGDQYVVGTHPVTGKPGWW